MDINGWGYGYSQALYDSGIKRFYTSIHNHHGFVPFKKKQMPFYWQTPNKDKILVWHGDVYNQGNVAKLMPNVIANHENGFSTEAIIDEERLHYAKEWLDDHLSSIRTQGYDFDFLPILTKGLLVDNAPPNKHIMEAIKRFNEMFGDDMFIELIGINDFFDKIENMDLPIETYSGDWPDWWSDGYMSSPKSVSLYKEAQRNYQKILSLQKEKHTFDAVKLDLLEYNLMMFSEHTWGYFTSVSEPWNKMTSKLDSRNQMFSAIANKISDELLDEYKESNGEMMKAAGRPMRYKVKNPYNYKRTEMVKLYVNWWEDFIVEKGYKLFNLKTNEELHYQELLVDQKSRKEVNTLITLEPYEDVVLEIRKCTDVIRKMPLDPLFTRDETYDYRSPYLDNDLYASQFVIESPFMKISFEKDLGVTEFIDKTRNKSLIREDLEHPLFSPVYEVNKVEYKYKFEPSEMAEVRRNIGRNRKLFSATRFSGQLINTKVVETGPLLSKVQLKYQLEGTIYSVVELTLYKDKPQLDISYICGKETVWEPENLYLSLPLTYSSKEVLWVQKGGVDIRPRIDQLPGTLTSFYTMNNGYSLVSEDGSMSIASLDSPILHVGSIKPSEIILHEDCNQKNTDIQYSWLMNNYWETNFNTSLGGFYQYDFSLFIDNTIKTKEKAIKKVDDLCNSFIISQVKEAN